MDVKEVYGIILVVLTATQFLGQAVKSLRTKSTRDLSWWTFIITWVISALWTLFGIWRDAPEIIWANVIVNISCIVILAAKYSTEKPKISRQPITMIAMAGFGAVAMLAIGAVVTPSLRAVLGWVTVTLNVNQLVPQAIKSLRTKSTKDLSWLTFLQIFVISIMWAIYGIWNGLNEVIATNVLANIICDVILVRKYISEKRRSA